MFLSNRDPFRAPQPSKVEFTNRQWVAFCIIILLIITLAATLGYVNGEGDGYDQAVEDNETSNVLPECEEDEFLYPVNYKGPGNNEPADYECIHTEVAVSRNVVETLVAIGEMTAEDAEAYMMEITNE